MYLFKEIELDYVCPYKGLYYKNYCSSASLNEIVPKALVSNSIFDFCWSTLLSPLLLCWPIKRRRTDFGELISECSTANMSFLLRFWNNKQYNELKTNCFLSSRHTSFNYWGGGSLIAFHNKLVFAIAIHIHTSLIFSGKVGVYQSGTTYRSPP